MDDSGVSGVASGQPEQTAGDGPDVGALQAQIAELKRVQSGLDRALATKDRELGDLRSRLEAALKATDGNGTALAAAEATITELKAQLAAAQQAVAERASLEVRVNQLVGALQRSSGHAATLAAGGALPIWEAGDTQETWGARLDALLGRLGPAQTTQVPGNAQPDNAGSRPPAAAGGGGSFDYATAMADARDKGDMQTYYRLADEWRAQRSKK